MMGNNTVEKSCSPRSSDAKEAGNKELGPSIFSKDISKDLKISQEVPPLRFHGLPRMS